MAKNYPPPTYEFSETGYLIPDPKEDSLLEAMEAKSQLTDSTLPLPAASASEVRDYIRGLLIVKHSITAEYAEKIAVLWKIGRGWTLRALSKDDLQNALVTKSECTCIGL